VYTGELTSPAVSWQTWLVPHCELYSVPEPIYKESLILDSQPVILV
jgi:hypothetical protein